MLALRQYSLAGSLVLLFVFACDRKQPVEPSIEAASTGTAGPAVKPPSNTSAVAVSESWIDVTWQDNSTNETGFEVHRSPVGASGPFALLASTGAGVTSYSDPGLTPSTQYCYEVRAFKTYDGRTRYSDFSNTACATPPPPPPSEAPAAPTLWAADSYPWFVQLWWFDNSANEDGFKVERCAGVACGDSDSAVILVIAVIATTGSRDYFYQDGTGVPGTTYTYRVRAFNRAGDSAPSNGRSAYFCFPLIVDEWGEYVCG